MCYLKIMKKNVRKMTPIPLFRLFYQLITIEYDRPFVYRNTALVQKMAGRIIPKETQPIHPMVFTPDSVMKMLQSTSPRKAAGPDELHQNIMRALAPFTAEPLTELFNLSLLTTELPEEWWPAIICP